MSFRHPLLSCSCGLLLALATFRTGTAVGAPAEVAAGQNPHAALLAQCQAVLPRTDAWRARRLREAMFRLQISTSWRRAPGRMTPQELRSAAASERNARDYLADICKPFPL